MNLVNPESDIVIPRRLASLVQICQRVASAHVENMCSLGEEIPIDLVRPILQNCPADVLDKLEQATPTLCQETSEMWKALCFRAFPLTAEQHFAAEEPESWRDAYFRLKDFEQERLDAVAAKLRVKREEERKRKEGTQIKYTDKVPPAKRARGTGWGQSQPKTLFQKTRSDAVKLHKGIYGARAISPVQMIKTSRNIFHSPNSSVTKPSQRLFPAPGPSSEGMTGTRVTVTSVPKNRPIATSRPPTESISSPSDLRHPAGQALARPTGSALSKPSPNIANSVLPRVLRASLPPSALAASRPPAEAQVDLPKVRKAP